MSELEESKILSCFNQFEPAKVVIIGDLILDIYTFGKIARISPEAPVTVLEVQKETMRLGGAANVALNLKALGMKPSLIGCVGDDISGRSFLDQVEAEEMSSYNIYFEKGRKTIVKNRLIASGQQIVRVDKEQTHPIFQAMQDKLFEACKQELIGAKALVISDYAKGTLTPELLQKIIQFARLRDVPVIVDPKGLDFSKYLGATVIKPNEKEAYLAAGLEHFEPIEKAGQLLLEKSGSEAIFITRADKGIAVFEKNNNRAQSKALVRRVKDVTGAGDTVCATLACCMANGWSFSMAADLANVAASLSIEDVGCVAVTLSELSKRLLEHHFTSKVFEQSHLFALKQVLLDRPFILLALEECPLFSAALFHAVRTLKSEVLEDERGIDSPKSLEVVVYLDAGTCKKDLLSILTSLEEVDYIIEKGESLKSLCQEIDPYKIYSFKEGILEQVSHFDEVLI